MVSANQILASDSSNVLGSISPGSSGQVLTSNGGSSLPSFQNAVGGSLVYIGSQTANNSASVVFTSGISATYNTYFVTFNHYVPATASTNLILRVSSNSGSSYITTGYNSIVFWSNTTGATQNNTTTGFNLIGNTIANSAAEGCGSFYMYNVTNGGQPAITGTIGYFDVAPSAATGTCYGRGPSATTVNAIQFIASSGNITTGVFNLYGVRES